MTNVHRLLENAVNRFWFKALELIVWKCSQTASQRWLLNVFWESDLFTLMAIAVGIVYRPTSEWFRTISTPLKSILDWHFESDWCETANLNCLKKFFAQRKQFQIRTAEKLLDYHSQLTTLLLKIIAEKRWAYFGNWTSDSEAFWATSDNVWDFELLWFALLGCQSNSNHLYGFQP